MVVRYLGKIAAVAALGLLASACAGSVKPGAATDRGARVIHPGQPMQCVPYARAESGISIFGDAYTWWDQAAGRFARTDRPRVGAVLVLADYAGPKRAHLAVVRRIASSRAIVVDHANWLNDGAIYLNSPVVDASPRNDWSEVRVWHTPGNHLGGRTYKVRGFITPDPDADSWRVASR